MIEQAKNICIIRLSGIKNPTVADINSAIDDSLKIFPNLVSERDALYSYLEATFSIFSDDYRILDTDEGYKPWIKDKKKDIHWRFWNRYVSYMQKKIAPDTINKLDNLTDDIIDRLIDPTAKGAWDKRGMVVGQVQSGKTGNYTGLINKAADAGFRLVIVLAGMHDSLRSQTQIRIDEGFLGFNTQTAMNFTNAGNRIGVGMYDKNLAAHSLTTSHLDGDFKRQAAQSSGINIRGNDPIILVVKKNGSILKNLISWLSVRGEKMPDGKIIIRDMPLLLIDDEADNASINVSKDKVSTINGCIRALLSLFEQSAYVGYTATPFANIFIPILDEEKKKGLDLKIKDFEFTVGQDLFPKDFIINIPAPSNYIGPAKVFGLPQLTSSDREIEPLPVIRVVDDYEAFDPFNNQEQLQNLVSGVSKKVVLKMPLVPNKHKKDDPLPDELPSSLKYAIKCFMLSAAARRARGQAEAHNSMLVHVSRYIIWQDRIATLVDRELKFYQSQLELKQGNLIPDLKILWAKEFEPITKQIIRDTHNYSDPDIKPIKWEKIEKELYAAVSKIEVRAVHGDKNLTGLTHHNISPLDYFFSEQQKPPKYLSVIAVGGDKLSRGLTLEGLTISYYLRASKMYDTLMQMGRWFGYRPGYADLCRIFTSAELIGWYKHITIASEEVRRDFDYMFLLKKTPREFGLKVRTHPDVLKITAANKFRYSFKMQLSYSGELEQTYRFKIDKDIFRNNYNATVKLLEELGKPLQSTINSIVPQDLIWGGENNTEVITRFLSRYKIGTVIIHTGKIIDYINAQVKHGNLVNWTVALIKNSAASEENKWKFSIDGKEQSIGLTSRTNIDTVDYEITKANILSGEHEMIDLSDSQIYEAIRQTKNDWIELKRDRTPDKPSPHRIKGNRDSRNGLLLIYPLNHNCVFKDPKTEEKTEKIISDVPVIGIALSFPDIVNDEKIEYAVNEQFKKEFDYPDELDLNDETDGTD